MKGQGEGNSRQRGGGGILEHAHAQKHVHARRPKRSSASFKRHDINMHDHSGCHMTEKLKNENENRIKTNVVNFDTF